MAGCTLVLMLPGAAAAVLGSALAVYQQILERIGGILLILFGLVLTGLMPVAVGVASARSTFEISSSVSTSTTRRVVFGGLSRPSTFVSVYSCSYSQAANARSART